LRRSGVRIVRAIVYELRAGQCADVGFETLEFRLALFSSNRVPSKSLIGHASS
jgi:hypothetical protein